jgi:WD40 repeat protein
MTTEDLLTDLLTAWQDAADAGTPVTPEQACRDHPDLLPAFTRLLRQLGHLQHVLDGPTDPHAFVRRFDAGRYRPVSFHAAGGLGVVAVAEDKELNRSVALKVMQQLAALDPVARHRFLQEAEITGKLEHPGVAPVYGAGEDPAGRPYYAMRFIQGSTLGDAIDRYHASTADPVAKRLEFARLLRCFASVCQTVAYAHARGVIHRDIKPGNVMLGPYGETLLVDWGLAKRFDLSDEPAARPGFRPVELAATGETTGGGQTVGGQVKGSPAFMAPEQARGEWDRVGPAADVYALGATLYVLLTGRPPYTGETVGGVIQAVRAGPPKAVREVNAAAPKPLAAVCAKAMARTPDGRYASAQALAAEVERWLADEPVTAYREPFATRCRRWVKRHRVLATAAAAAVVVLAAVLAVVVPVLANQNRTLEDQKNTITGQADELVGKNIAIQAKADEVAKQNVTISLQAADVKEKAAAVQRESEERRKKAEELADALYDASVPRARLEWASNNVRIAEGVLDGLDPARRGWEWRHLKWLCHPKFHALRHSTGYDHVAVSRDGKGIAAASLLFQQVELRIRLDGKEYLTVPRTLSLGEKAEFGQRDRITELVLAPDRRWVAAANSKRVKVWAVGDHKVLADWPGTFDGLGVSPDGGTLALGERNQIRLIDTKAWKERANFATDEWANGHLVFDPKGKQLATTDVTANTVRVWDLTKEKVTLTVRSGRAVPGRAAFDPSGKLVAFGVDNAVEVYDLTAEWKPGQEVRPAVTFLGHTHRVRCVAFHPTKPLVATGSDDGTINLWQPRLNEPVATLRGHTEVVHTLAFLDGGELLSAGRDDIRIWPAADEPEGFLRQGTEAAVSGDGRYVATTGFGRRYPTDEPAKAVWLWDARTGELVREFAPGKGELGSFEVVAFSRDGRHLAGGSRSGLGGGSITVWEAGTGKVANTIKVGDGVQRMAYHPDGKTLVAGTQPFEFNPQKRPPVTLRFFDPATGKERAAVPLEADHLNSLAFNPAGSVLAVAGDWGVKLLDGTSGAEMATLPEAGRGATFSPDGRFILTTGRDRSNGNEGWIKVWDVATRRVAYTLRGHTLNGLLQTVNAACMSEDGSRVFSVGEDGLVLVWNTATRREILRLQHGFGQRAIHTVLYVPGGDYLVTASGGGIFPGFTRIWPTATAPPK